LRKENPVDEAKKKKPTDTVLQVQSLRLSVTCREIKSLAKERSPK